MSDNFETGGSSFGRALGAFFRAVLKFILAVAALGLVGLIVYFGVIYLYREIIYPIQTNQYKMDDLGAQITLNQELVTERLSGFNDRLVALESQGDLNVERFNQLESDLGVAGKDLKEQKDRWKTAARWEKSLEELDERLAALEEALAKTPEPDAGPELAEASQVVELRAEVGLLKTMSLLSRSRASLLQKNYALALEDAQNALTVLESVLPDLPEAKAAAAEGLVDRISLALENLPDNPVLAAEDLEIAWRTLVDNLLLPSRMKIDANLNPLEAETLNPTAGAEGTLTPTPNSTVTPTP